MGTWKHKYKKANVNTFIMYISYHKSSKYNRHLHINQLTTIINVVHRQ